MNTSRRAWHYWFPDRGETEEDRHEWIDREDREVDRVASDIAERKWHDWSPDYFDEIAFVLVDPHGEWHRVEVCVEPRPCFIGRELPRERRRTSAKPGGGP